MFNAQVDYPKEIESWWVAEACRHYRVRDERTAMARLAPAAGTLSDLFTKERTASFQDYANDPELRLAYGLYAFPQTHSRMALLIAELKKLGYWQPLSARQNLRLLDVGAGAGAASVALLQALNESTVDITAFDQSSDLLRQYRQILYAGRAHWPKATWKVEQASPGQWPNGRAFDLIVLSFSLGEICYGKPSAEATEYLDRWREWLNPGGLLLLIEPSLKETSTRLMEVRDALLGRDWRVLAPCPHQAGCPMLAEKKFWCHEVRPWKQPPSLQRLNNHLRRSVHELKFSFLALQAPSGEHQECALPNDRSRLVAPLAKLNGRFATRVCDASGVLQEVEIQTRVLTSDARRRLNKIHRGDWARLHNRQPLKSPEHYRLPTAESWEVL